MHFRLLYWSMTAVLVCVAVASAGAQPVELATGDGVRLQLSAEGQVTGFSIGTETLKLAGAGGFAVADYTRALGAGAPIPGRGGAPVQDSQAAGVPAQGDLPQGGAQPLSDPVERLASRRGLFQPVTGSVAREGAAARFVGRLPDAKLELAAHFIPGQNCIRVEGEVRDLSDADRAVVVSFRLPLDFSGWTWHDDIAQQRVVDKARIFINTYNCLSGDGVCSAYPLASLSGRGVGLSCGLPLSQGPRVFVLGYDGETQQAFVNFYFGLTRQVNKWPGRAAFSFVLYRHDPVWGMRAAWERYYALYPESFRKRPTFEGYLNYANQERFDPKTHRLIRGGGNSTSGPEDASDFGEGYRFVWHLHGCYDFRMFPTEQREKLKDETVWQLLRTRAEQERAKPASYCPVTETIKKIVTGADGEIKYIGDTRYFNAHEGYNRNGERPGWGLNFRVSEDPEISPVLAQATQRALEAYATQGPHRPFEACLTADAIEGYCANRYGLDYRPEHLAATDLPPSFGRSDLKPAIVNNIWDFHQTVWRPLSEKYQVLTYGNGSGYEQAFTVPFVDILMFELYPSDAGRWDRYLRTMAHHKIARSYYYRKDSMPEHFDRRLAYAIFPSACADDARRSYFRQYLPAIEALSAAGWEPIPYARTSGPDVVVERYGDYRRHDLHFTFRNYATEPKQVNVALDLKGLGVPAEQADELMACDLLQGFGAPQPVAVQGWNVTIEANSSRAFWLGTPEHLARRALTLAEPGLGRIERLFRSELSEANRTVLAEARQCVSATTAENPPALLTTVALLQGLLDGLEAAIETRAPIDRAKVFYRIQSELSAAVFGLLRIQMLTPRTAVASQGAVTTVPITVTNAGDQALAELSFSLVSPWPETAHGSKMQNAPVLLPPGKQKAFSVSLSAPAKPERELLPFLVQCRGQCCGKPFRFCMPVDVVLSQSLPENGSPHQE